MITIRTGPAAWGQIYPFRSYLLRRPADRLLPAGPGDAALLRAVAPPTEAARRALAIQRRPDSTATVFEVEWTDTPGDPCGTEVTHRVQIDLPAASAPPSVGCGTCNDVRWLADGDISRAWAERCDDCGDLLDDDQAADLAATQLDAGIGHDTVGGGSRPYLVGITFAEAYSRWSCLATAGARRPTGR